MVVLKSQQFFSLLHNIFSLLHNVQYFNNLLLIYFQEGDIIGYVFNT